MLGRTPLMPERLRLGIWKMRLRCVAARLDMHRVQARDQLLYVFNSVRT